MKFSESRFRYGSDGVELPAGTKLVATELRNVWVLWEDGKPTKHVEVVPGQPPITRDQLGYNDKSQWPLGLLGEQEDPYKYRKILVFCVSENWRFIHVGPGRASCRALARRSSCSFASRPRDLAVAGQRIAGDPGPDRAQEAVGEALPLDPSLVDAVEIGAEITAIFLGLYPAGLAFVRLLPELLELGVDRRQVVATEAHLPPPLCAMPVRFSSAPNGWLAGPLVVRRRFTCEVFARSLMSRC